ncbi:pentatricopeptide repeat-containing protein, partial [Tanacetum coccineum]
TVDEVYQKMLESRVIPNQVFFFALMKEFPKGHELHLTLNILNVIAKHGCGINPLYSSISFGPTQNIEYAIEHPLISAYNSLIKCFCQEGFGEHATTLIRLMKGMGRAPDLTTFLIMVNEHCKRGDLAVLGKEKRVFDAHRLLKKMLESGVYPDEALYAKMINVYSKNGQAYEANRLFNRMTEHGIQPDSRAYSALISGLVKKNKLEKGVTYLGSMFKDGFMLNKVFYTSLIGHFLRKRELEFAFRLVSLTGRSHIECDQIGFTQFSNG